MSPYVVYDWYLGISSKLCLSLNHLFGKGLKQPRIREPILVRSQTHTKFTQIIVHENTFQEYVVYCYHVGVQDLPLDKSPDKKNHNSRNINPIYNGLPDRKTNAVNSFKVWVWALLSSNYCWLVKTDQNKIQIFQ